LALFLLAGIGTTLMAATVMNTVITTEELGGKDRKLFYISSDKPIYRVAETVYLRAVILNGEDNTPVTVNNLYGTIKILGPKGDTVYESGAYGDDSTIGFSWVVPDGVAGGEYNAIISSPSLGITESERSFDIRAYRAPRLKTQIEFTREGYGPGDQVQATVQVDRAEGGIPSGAKVTVIARVDGEEVFKQDGFVVSDTGSLQVDFSLPKTIDTGDGTLAFVIEDGGVVETASKTLPILLQNLDITFYPEGGDLVVDLTSRVYVQAWRPDGKPADISGRIVEFNGKAHGKKVAKLTTEHEGRGRFVFTPDSGKSYALVLDSPAGIKREFPLPKAKDAGAVIESTVDVYDYDQPITLSVHASENAQAKKVTLYKREQILDSQAVTFGEPITLNGKDSEGVLIATVWDASGQPLAERLIYRKPKFAVIIDIKATTKASSQTGTQVFMPASTVTLDITSKDENGKPVEAIVGLTVTDDAILSLIDQREQAPRLPVMVYLENEVRDMGDAHVYLDNSNPKAAQAVDLLLATQGWRRFILVDFESIKQQYPKEAARALAEKNMVLIRKRKNQNIGVIALAQQQNREENNIDPKPVLEQAVLPVRAKAAEQKQKVMEMAEMADMQIVAKRFNVNGKLKMEAPIVLGIIREFAYQVRANRQANDRIDFTETLYWHKGIRTSARDGKATVSFGLSDSISTFKVMADAFGRNGALGSQDLMINSVEPFYIEPKMPLEVTAGDHIELPVSLINATEESMSSAKLLVKGEGLEVTQAKAVSLQAGARVRQIVTVVAAKPGSYLLEMSAAADGYTDKVTRTLMVKPKGFPIKEHLGGLLSSKQQFNTNIIIPKEITAGSITTLAKIYPSPLANMEEALNALLRQPNGCFEQTSSSNYPLVMAQQYFMTHQGVDPTKIAKAKGLLAAGYQKLIGFESTSDGYEWFGANPAHEALTAYGLMEFVDMAKVMPVDDAMIVRTKKWLLERRDGQGGFKRNGQALDSFGRAPPATTNAYIVWSLLESGESPSTLRKEIAAINTNAMVSNDHYVVALAANILSLSGDKKGASLLAKKLAEAVNKDGSIDAAKTSITQSGGDALAIETTSLALLAWLKNDGQWAAQIETSMKWLFERAKSGRFGSTQSTILALKAINAYDQARSVPKNSGSVQLLVDGKPFGKAVVFTKNSKGAIELPDFAASLDPGKHSLSIVMSDGSEMPFALEVSYNTTVPVSADKTPVTLVTKLVKDEVLEGEPLELVATVTVGSDIAPTPIAIVGIPAGLEVRHDQLKELVAANRISAYEVRGSEIILYWRALKAGEVVDVPISLTAAIPGIYTAPASRAYLYYTDEYKHWQAGHKVVIKAR
jgi:uncharacterized protein YfaS (alpha-2-macroglobulin family)